MHDDVTGGLTEQELVDEKEHPLQLLWRIFKVFLSFLQSLLRLSAHCRSPDGGNLLCVLWPETPEPESNKDSDPNLSTGPPQGVHTVH